MKDDLLEIYNHFGSDIQRKKLNEEHMELQEQLFWANYYVMANNTNGVYEVPFIKEVIGELADVTCLLKQIQYIYKISDKDLEEEMKIKIERTKKRIKEGYYE